MAQNGNWHAFVDGNEVDIVLIGDAMIGVPMREGSHEVVFVYENEAFSLGWKVTLGCFLVFLGLVVWKYKPKQHKGKYEK